MKKNRSTPSITAPFLEAPQSKGRGTCKMGGPRQEVFSSAAHIQHNRLSLSRLPCTKVFFGPRILGRGARSRGQEKLRAPAYPFLNYIARAFRIRRPRRTARGLRRSRCVIELAAILAFSVVRASSTAKIRAAGSSFRQPHIVRARFSAPRLLFSSDDQPLCVSRPQLGH